MTIAPLHSRSDPSQLQPEPGNSRSVASRSLSEQTRDDARPCHIGSAPTPSPLSHRPPVSSEAHPGETKPAGFRRPSEPLRESVGQIVNPRAPSFYLPERSHLSPYGMRLVPAYKAGHSLVLQPLNPGSQARPRVVPA